MIDKIILLSLSLLLKFLDENSDYFEGTKSDKKSFIKDSGLPIFLQLYLLEVKEDKFLSDLKDTTNYLNNERVSSNNSLVKSISLFLSYSLAFKIDSLPSNYDLKNREDREKTLEEVISVKTELGKLLVEYISSSNLQVVYREIKSLANNFADHKSVIIQSSHNLSVDLKQNVREYFHKMDKFCFPIFAVQPSLIGGLRIILDGKTVDSSYANMINNLKV